MRTLSWLTFLALACTSCDRANVARANVLSLGDACAPDSKCREPLACVDGTCAPTGAVPLGGVCVISADCVEGAYCALGSCAQAGVGEVGEPCTSSADCSPTLRCEVSSFGAACAEGGPAYVDEPCTGASDCMAGLVCDTARHVCATEQAAPFGDACTDDFSCQRAGGAGYFCVDGRCTGLGPDGAVLPVWTGASCAASPRTLDGAFRVHFEVSPAGDDFFRQPFPSDARIVDGKVSLEGFPRPGTAVVPADTLGRYVQAIEAEQTAFGPNQSVFFRFNGAPVFCGQGCGDTQGASPEAGCMGSGEAAPSVYVLDLTRDGGGSFPASPFTPIPYRWTASVANTPYICGPWLAVIPDAVRTWVPGHTYAVFVHARVMGCDGTTRVAIAQDDEFAAVLSTTPPTETTARAVWDAYEPLRAWLATAPSYPGGGAVAATDLAGATVFTIRDPARLMGQLADAVLAASVPAVSDVLVCSSAAAGPDCTVPSTFTEVRGTVALPRFQTGTAPFLDEGGDITATPQGTTSVRFAISIPSGAAPSSGWPVVLYAHGTGGNYRSHIEEGLAAGLADLSVALGPTSEHVAVLGVDQVAHGTRVGEETISSERLFFNFANPQAARGNVLQAAADQLALLRAIAPISAALAAQPGLSGATLDASRVAFVGHSQGGIEGAVGMPYAQGVTTVVLSGTGGGLLDSFNSKTSPYNLKALLSLALADPTFTNAREHPALSLMQGYLEESDPTNYARLLNRAPVTGRVAKHVLHFVGVGDTFTPNVTGMSFARRLEATFVDSEPTGLPTGSEVKATPPVRKNKTSSGTTAVTSLHSPLSGHDGHFVMFDVQGALVRMQQFVGSWLVDPEHVPTLVP